MYTKLIIIFFIVAFQISGYAQVPRKVLLEEFTGTWSINAPAAHDSIKKIDSLFPGKCLVASNHNADSLMNSYGIGLENALGVSGYPRACIDRDTFAYANYFAMSRWYWINAVADRMNLTSPVSITLNNNFNNTNRQLNVDVNYTFHAELDEPLRVTCLVVEDNIIVDQAGYGPNYKLNNVVRLNLSSDVWGDSNNSNKVGLLETFIKHYSITLPNNLNSNNLRILAFINKKNGSNPIAGFGTEILNAESQAIVAGALPIENNNVSTNIVSDVYPNPSHELCVIDIDLANNSQVKATVFNTQGLLIKQLANGARSKGKHKLYWAGSDRDGQKISAGIYFVAIEINGEKYIRKVVFR